MKSSAWDNKLWHDKMLEIPLEGDADSAWNKMQGMLNETMPVTQTGTVVKKLWGISRSLLLTVLYTAAAAAIIILATHIISKENHRTTPKHHKQNVKPYNGKRDTAGQVDKDSTLNNTPVTSVTAKDSTGADNTSPNNSANPAATPKDDKAAVPDTISGSPSKHSAALTRSTIAQGNLAAKGTKGNAAGKGNTTGKVPVTAANNNVQAQNTLVRSHTAHQTIVGHSGHGRKVGVKNAGITYTSTGSPANTGHNQTTGKNLLANENASKSNTLIKGNTSSPNQKPDNTASNTGAILSSKTDSAKAAINKDLQSSNPTTPANTLTAKDKEKAQPQPKAKIASSPAYSKFEAAIEAGVNAGKGSTIPFVGLSGSYAINRQLSISIGGNVFSSRIIAGSYSKKKYKYTTEDDSARITKRTALIVVNSSQKIYTFDIPVTATYKLNKWLSLKGGPVISIPIKTGAISNTLAPVGTTLDTARAYKALLSAVNSTTIPNKINIGLSGGAIINLNRLYFDAGYVQGMGAYTIHSSLGTGKVYYHTLQFGIGYKLFKSKPKPVRNK